MVRVRVEAALIEDRIYHRELAEGDSIARLELRSIPGNRHHPLVVRRKQHRPFESPRDVEEVLNEASLVLERVWTPLPLHHRARRLPQAPRVRVERDHLDATRSQ